MLSGRSTFLIGTTSSFSSTRSTRSLIVDSCTHSGSVVLVWLIQCRTRGLSSAFCLPPSVSLRTKYGQERRIWLPFVECFNLVIAIEEPGYELKGNAAHGPDGIEERSGLISRCCPSLRSLTPNGVPSGGCKAVTILYCQSMSLRMPHISDLEFPGLLTNQDPRSVVGFPTLDLHAEY